MATFILEKNNKMKVEIYSDGSSEGNSTGRGGWSYVIVVDGVKYRENSGHLAKATNNIAEITGAIEGLAYVTSDSTLCTASEVILISDSQLVLRYATGEYQCRKFHLVPYYIKLRNFFKHLNATTRWVKGHTGDTYNERCDELAKAARECPPIQ